MSTPLPDRPTKAVIPAYRRPTPPRLGWFHLQVWLVCWFFTAAIAVKGLWGYNEVAGTDKTPSHIAAIAFGSSLGTYCGPLANPGGGTQIAHRFGWPSLALLLATLVPFVAIRKPLRRGWNLLFRLIYTAAVVWWFFTAIASLSFSLS